MWEVPESCLAVAAESGHLEIDGGVLHLLAEDITGAAIDLPPWDFSHHFFDGTEKSVAFLTVLDTVNFCFWAPPGKPRWEFDFEGTSLSGYAGLAASLTTAMKGGVALASADYLAQITAAELARVLGGSGTLLLMEGRASALRELGRVLLRDYHGKAHLMVEEAEGSAVALARLLSGKLQSFRDTAVHRGRPVWFLKRAQILTADLFGAFGGTKWGRFHDMDRITAFADYKVPQVLRQLGILRYSAGLASKVDHMVPIPAGSIEEIEIRAATVAAVEKLRGLVSARGGSFNAHELDWMLWSMGQHDRFRKKPYHRTETIFY